MYKIINHILFRLLYVYNKKNQIKLLGLKGRYTKMKCDLDSFLDYFGWLIWTKMIGLKVNVLVSGLWKIIIVII